MTASASHLLPESVMFHVRSFILYLAVIKVELQLHLYGVLKAQNFLTAGHPVQRTDLRDIFRFTLNKVFTRLCSSGILSKLAQRHEERQSALSCSANNFEGRQENLKLCQTRYSVPAAVRVSKALLSSTRRIIWKGTASLKLLEMARLEKTDDAISEGTNVLCEAGEFCPTILPLTREDSVVGRMSGIPCLCAGMLDKILRDHTLRKRRRRDNN